MVGVSRFLVTRKKLFWRLGAIGWPRDGADGAKAMPGRARSSCSGQGSFAAVFGSISRGLEAVISTSMGFD